MMWSVSQIQHFFRQSYENYLLITRKVVLSLVLCDINIFWEENINFQGIYLKTYLCYK